MIYSDWIDRKQKIVIFIKQLLYRFKNFLKYFRLVMKAANSKSKITDVKVNRL